MSGVVHDFFISYKHSESHALAVALHDSLSARNLSVWLDQKQIAPGDSILATIELGMSSSVDAVLLISPNYFSGWAEQERRALYSKMVSGRFRIVPVLHGISPQQLAAHSPMLADISSLVAEDSSSHTAEVIAQKLVESTRPDAKEVRLYEMFLRCVLQQKGYDADIAFWLGVLEDNGEAVRAALGRGANPRVTLPSIYNRHCSDALTCGCFEEWRKLYLHLVSTGKA